jgi:hypothetical protein
MGIPVVVVLPETTQMVPPFRRAIDATSYARMMGPGAQHLPTILLTGLLITGLLNVLVSISSVTRVLPDRLGDGETPLLQVVQAGAPNFPIEILIGIGVMLWW